MKASRFQAHQDVVVADVAVPKGTFITCVMRPAGMDPGHFDDPMLKRICGGRAYGHKLWNDRLSMRKARGQSSETEHLPLFNRP